MAEVFNAPDDTSIIEVSGYNGPSIFLAGSIDMGKAVDWQSEVINGLKDEDVVIFNPRRSDWDSTWEQKIENKKFNEQVTWEMNHMDKASIICYVFDPAGKAPITLMELGLHAHEHRKNKKLVVCCPEGFWRKGNVDIVCARYGIPQVDSVPQLIGYLKAIL